MGDEPEPPVGLPRAELELDQEMLGREHPGRPIRPLDRDDAGRVKDLLEAEPLKIRRLEPVEIDVRERHRPPVLVDEGERGAAHGAGHPEAAGEPLHEAGLPRSRRALDEQVTAFDFFDELLVLVERRSLDAGASEWFVAVEDGFVRGVPVDVQ